MSLIYRCKTGKSDSEHICSLLAPTITAHIVCHAESNRALGKEKKNTENKCQSDAVQSVSTHLGPEPNHSECPAAGPPSETMFTPHCPCRMLGCAKTPEKT